MDDKEIIRALRLCMDNNLDACEACPAVNGHCEEVKGCAADLIERQAAEIAKYKGVGEKYEQEIQRLTRERDAAVRDIAYVTRLDYKSPCAACVSVNVLPGRSPCVDCIWDDLHFVWRGLCAENGQPDATEGGGKDDQKAKVSRAVHGISRPDRQPQYEQI